MSESLDLDESRHFQLASSGNDERGVASKGVSFECNGPSAAERVEIMALVNDSFSENRLESNTEGTESGTDGKSYTDPNVAQVSSTIIQNGCTVRSYGHMDHQSLKRTCPAIETIMEATDSGLISSTNALRTPGVDSSGVQKRRKYTYHTRARGKQLGPSPLKARRVFESRSTKEEDFRQWECCKALSCFRIVDLQRFRTERTFLLAASQQKRKEYLACLLRNDGKFEFDGRRVCAQFLIQGFGFSKDLQRAVKGTASIVMQSAVMSKEPGANAHQRRIILEFLEHYTACQMASTEMPESRAFPCFQKKHIYRLLLRQIKSSETETDYTRSVPTLPSFSYFVSVWNTYYGRVRLGQGMECEQCTDYRNARPGDDNGRCSEISDKRRDHLQLVERERVSYNYRKNFSITEPQNVCSIAIGGLQQTCFSLPHFCDLRMFKKRKFTKCNVVGLVENRPENNLQLFIHMNQFSNSCFVLIEIIHQFVNKSRVDGKKSKVLLIDLNISRAEVNEVCFLCYLECLVAWGIYEEIQVFFSLPGHACSDLLHGSRCVAESLTKGDIKSLAELQKELKLSSKLQTTTSIIETAANISGLLEQESLVRKTQSTAEYRLFKLTRATEVPRQGTGRFLTSCFVRGNCTEAWRPLFEEDPTHGLLVKAPDFRLTPPTRTSVYTESDSLQNFAPFSREIAFSWDLSRCVEGRAVDF